jgi:hypothetical protein
MAMVAFVTSYWIATLPTIVAGVIMLGALKKMRDEKAKAKAPATVPVPVRRK